MQEHQKYVSDRRNLEKEKAECMLRMKELEHKIAKFNKDTREAAQKVIFLGGRGLERLFMVCFTGGGYAGKV